MCDCTSVYWQPFYLYSFLLQTSLLFFGQPPNGTFIETRVPRQDLHVIVKFILCHTERHMKFVQRALCAAHKNGLSQKHLMQFYIELK